jgi:hypothetical protein
MKKRILEVAPVKDPCGLFIGFRNRSSGRHFTPAITPE